MNTEQPEQPGGLPMAFIQVEDMHEIIGAGDAPQQIINEPTVGE
jgi:hypothetical protein